MCGHFIQGEGMAAFMAELQPRGAWPTGYDTGSASALSVMPAHRAHILHSAEDGLHIDAVRWGWAPFGAQGKQADALAMPVETLPAPTLFKLLWPNSRALVPCDGWFERAADAQLYFVRLKTRKTMFFAALAHVHRGAAAQQGAGFVIMTSAAEGKMAALHAQRPVVLTPELANEWLDLDLSPRRAEQIVTHLRLDTTAFEWLRVMPAAPTTTACASHTAHPGHRLARPLTSQDAGKNHWP